MPSDTSTPSRPSRSMFCSLIRRTRKTIKPCSQPPRSTGNRRSSAGAPHVRCWHADFQVKGKYMAQLRHFAIVVRDQEKSAKFYEEAFGLKLAGFEDLGWSSAIYLS